MGAVGLAPGIGGGASRAGRPQRHSMHDMSGVSVMIGSDDMDTSGPVMFSEGGSSPVPRERPSSGAARGRQSNGASNEGTPETRSVGVMVSEATVEYLRGIETTAGHALAGAARAESVRGILVSPSTEIDLKKAWLHAKLTPRAESAGTAARASRGGAGTGTGAQDGRPGTADSATMDTDRSGNSGGGGTSSIGVLRIEPSMAPVCVRAAISLVRSGR